MQLIQFIGVAIFAVSGALTAGRKSLDLLGVIVIATVTAIGGGTLRDLLLDRHPVFWIAEPAYLYVILVASLLTIPYTQRFPPPDRTLLIADALGLAFFSISGAQIAEAAGVSGIGAVIMGTMTGAAGGVVRDVLCAEVPVVLRPGQLYATTAISGITVFLLLQGVLPAGIPALIGMACIAALRIASIIWDFTLPVFSLHDHHPPKA